MRLKICTIIILITLFLLFLLFIKPNEKSFYVKEVISPIEILLDNGNKFKLKGYETFDSSFSNNNKILAEKFNISEEDAFVIGNLGKYWAKNILEGRKIYITDNDIIYYKFGYKTRFVNSPYCIESNEFTNPKSAIKLIEKVKNTNYQVLDLKTEQSLELCKTNLPDEYIIVRSGYKKKKKNNSQKLYIQNQIMEFDNYKLIFTDFTQKLKPDRECNTDMCKEILNHINNAQSTIDMAIYGYSNIPKIEHAVKNAIKRGVKVRMVYDFSPKGKDTYPDTIKLTEIIKNSTSDKNSKEASFIMHNKFFIFDNKTLITGSANLSHTDMSGYNANILLIINSQEICESYTKEFEQMYSGKFHSAKSTFSKPGNIFFSPQDKTIKNGIIPLIRNANEYIYIPAFIIIEQNIVSELINAKARGVDVKIIADALNASAPHSKIKELRAGNIPVKIENYAGKLHSKVMIIDDTYLVLGSMNFSYSGENRNDENLLILNNTASAKFYKEFFLYLWEIIPDKWLKFYPKAEGLDSIGSCTDGIDNDYDGLTDSEEEACRIK